MEKKENNSSLGYKIRTIELEIRETKKEKEKISQEYLSGIVITSLFATGGLIWAFVKYKQEYFWEIIGSMILVVIFFTSVGIYWYNKYKSESKKIEKLEKKLYLLKLEAKK